MFLGDEIWQKVFHWRAYAKDEYEAEKAERNLTLTFLRVGSPSPAKRSVQQLHIRQERVLE